jgi:hypothetical protein
MRASEDIPSPTFSTGCWVHVSQLGKNCTLLLLDTGVVYWAFNSSVAPISDINTREGDGPILQFTLKLHQGAVGGPLIDHLNLMKQESPSFGSGQGQRC